MKSYIKFLCAATIIAAFGMNAFATNPSGEIKAKAEVRTLIEVSGEVDLDFMNVQVGEVKTVNARDAVTVGTSSGDETSGRFEITKAGSTDVRVEFTTLPETLARVGGGGTLPISFNNDEFGRLSLDVSTEGGVTFNPTSPIDTANNGSTQPFFNATTFSVYLGGTVTPGAEQPIGSYADDVILTVSYN